MAKYDTLEEGFAAAKAQRAERHLFLCLGPDCADLKEGEKTWQRLKELCASLNLPVMRTKAGCLRVCMGGPWLLIYPEGVWYGEVTPERCERIVRDHVVAGRPVEEWIKLRHPLCGAADGDSRAAC
jgi:(2Fe-2S) ferredoxin